MDNNKFLFELIKKEKWNEAMKNFDNNNLDINIRDKYNNYLIQYIIMNNKLDFLKLILKRNPKIDIIDNDGKNLLYIPIKFDYYEIVNEILKFNKNNIGLSIIDFQDKFKNIPLHYAIKYKNIKIIDLLLNYNSDKFIKDINGNNSLHLSIYTKNISIINKFIKDNNYINSVNYLGETALHIACSRIDNYEICKLLIENKSDPNIKDKETKLIPLIFSIYNNNIKLSSLLINNTNNLNIQDYQGNIPLHHSFKEKNKEISNLLIKKIENINLNLYNINLQYPLHILLYNRIDIDISKIIINTKINFQDDNGNSCLHLLCMNNIWKEYKDIISKKKLDIFLKNKKNKTPFDFIKNEDKELFIYTTAKSYLYLLRNKKNIWSDEWENICKNEIIFKNLNKNEKKILIKYTKNLNNKNICLNIIIEKLKILINDNNENKISYPIKKNKIFIPIQYYIKNNNNISIYTGESIDILFGLIYLLKKNKNTVSCLNNNLEISDKLYEFLKFNNININKFWFLNFQIIWILNKIYFPSNFFNILNKFKDKKRFFICPVGISTTNKGWHSNYLLIDLKKKEIERFEPNGSENSFNFDYSSEKLDNILKRELLFHLDNFKYFEPKHFIPRISVQILSSKEINNKKITDPQGFCALWSVWYVDIRLTYPEIDRKKLINKMIKNINKKNLSFKSLIRSYAVNIIEPRDLVLNKISINIEDFINQNINNSKFDEFLSIIFNILNKIIF